VNKALVATGFRPGVRAVSSALPTVGGALSVQRLLPESIISTVADRGFVSCIAS